MTTSDAFLMHIGILRKSGRYPWGSGENPAQRNRTFIDTIKKHERDGMTPVEIAKMYDMTTTQLRALKAITTNAERANKISTAVRLREEGNSVSAIGREMGLNESSVRALLAPNAKESTDVLITIADKLKESIGPDSYLDVSEGSENHLGITNTKLKTAVAMLEEDGYVVHKIKTPQLGTGKETTTKIVCPPDTDFREAVTNPQRIKTVAAYSENGGRTFLGIEKPAAVDPNRVSVRYAKDGGAEMDGVIELRRGVADTDLGSSRYAQVRIQVGPNHYLKGMAMYADDLPDGVDFRFNTNKEDSGNKFKAMKELKEDEDNPFGSIVRQKHYVGADGKLKLSPLNIVGSANPLNPEQSTSGEEGGWDKWSSKLSSQMMSKQKPELAKKQLDEAYRLKKAEFDEINSLTNPAVKKLLLEKFADGADSSSVSLKAAGLPRTKSKVLLPINSLKDDEIYAPTYRDGEKVVLIRHPHGGIFEIPELTVNNKNPDGKRLIPGAIDAVGINSKVAQRLSGADFDGDTVLVIPNKQSGPDRVKNMKPLKELEGFDPQSKYPKYDGMKTVDGGVYRAKTDKVEYPDKLVNGVTVKGSKSNGKQMEMGQISNLITDMTIQDAPWPEIARAVKHSMVVIDSEKHVLNYKQSAQDNGIKELKVKYQGGGNKGASTLISRASAEVRVDKRKARSAAEGGAIDKETGEKKYTYTNESYVDKKTGKTVTRSIKSTRLAEERDAHALSSGTVMEKVYADHSNELKALANQARKVAVNTPRSEYNASAAKTYKSEVTSLEAKLNTALKNKPLERLAQRQANAVVTTKRQADPNMDKDDLKKIKSMALAEARARVGASKQDIKISPAEWGAIQAGAISDNRLQAILQNTDLDVVKELAMPRQATVMVPARVQRAKQMAANGATPSQIADALGVAVSTVTSALSEKG